MSNKTNRGALIVSILATVAILALLGWGGYSGYKYFHVSAPSPAMINLADQANKINADLNYCSQREVEILNEMRNIPLLVDQSTVDKMNGLRKQLNDYEARQKADVKQFQELQRQANELAKKGL
jgi:hypothetical protein